MQVVRGDIVIINMLKLGRYVKANTMLAMQKKLKLVRYFNFTLLAGIERVLVMNVLDASKTHSCLT